jgi:asparagine synthase (glutamine-hydrolysing)
MSVQFGSWNFHRNEKETLNLAALREQLAPYGPDGESHFREDTIEILVYHLRETEDSSRKEQPFRINANRVLTWDGRLDNREDLVQELDGGVHSSDSDVALVAAAYRQWDLACLPKLIGDWALSVWDSQQRELVLAKDFLGTRPLFYSVDDARARWSSVLDPLVLLAGRQFALNREYLAGWFGLFPASHLTPYLEVFAVPPASHVVIRNASVQIREFWQFSSKRLVYRSDAEYEVHFRRLFAQSVRRRLRSHTPVLAELSGGMDSSSIVCMADQILLSREELTPRLDTISYYSSGEPNWDELPYVAKVEELRGRQGIHLQVHVNDFSAAGFAPGQFMATPGSLEPVGKSDFEFRNILRSDGYRIVLSGIGGDEVLGGVPLPFPWLADLLVSGRWAKLGAEFIAWALALRAPLTSLVRDTLALFLLARPASELRRPPSWLAHDFRKKQRPALHGYPRRTKLFGPRPSFQDNLRTLEALRRQLSCYPLPANPTYRKLYPYLDRDLLEFLFAIPSDQLFGPGRRRSLMRRALGRIVPRELLERRRKAFVIRAPLASISSQFPALASRAAGMLNASIGLLQPELFVAALDRARSGERIAITPIIRALAIERWFQSALQWQVFRDLESHRGCSSRPQAAEDQAAEQVS